QIAPMDVSDEQLPFVSVIIPAYCEEDVIEKSIEGVLNLDYPNFELIVVNDGKAMGLNDAILCAGAELILVIDADAVPDRQLLRKMTPHFQSARVGAV